VTYADALLHHLQRSMHRDLCVSFGDLALDDQGDITIAAENGPCYVSLLSEDGSSTTWARVWTIAAEDLKPTAKLLREINEINTEMLAARILLADNGRLVVTAEVRAESVEPGELGDLVHIVGRCAARIGPLVGIVHGGAPTALNKNGVT
jgi:hypothetical protein